MTCRKLSGSSRSPKAVDPVTSQNSTVTVLRCWRGACGRQRRAALAAEPRILRVRPTARGADLHTSQANPSPLKCGCEGPDVPSGVIRREQAQPARCGQAEISQNWTFCGRLVPGRQVPARARIGNLGVLARLETSAGLTVPSRIADFRFSGAYAASLHVAGYGLMGDLAAETVSRCRSMWPGAC